MEGGSAGVDGAHTYKQAHATFGTENNAHAPSDMLRKGTGIGGGVSHHLVDGLADAGGGACAGAAATAGSAKPHV